MAEIDKRSVQDILKELRERSASYTPEWRFNENDPDIAAVLAMAYADMAAGTVKKLNSTPLKNKIAFFNTANASLLPAEPSEGYVRFSLASGDSAETLVPLGTVLAAPSDSDDTVHFESSDDILVSQASIDAIFCTDDSEDYIGEYTDFRENGVLLFDKSPKNLQSHTMLLAHPYLFDVRGSSHIRICFFRRGGLPVPPASLSALADRSAAAAAYFAGEENGFIPFREVRQEDGALILGRDEKMPAPAADENGNFLLRITAEDVSRFEDFAFMRITAAAAGSMIPCDTVSDGASELRRESFFPFGERFQLYNEVYFGAGEALSKRGAEITVSFDVHYLSIPMENALPEEEIQYKWIAEKGDFKESREYEIAITEVIWEYYNGYGWRRLFEDGSHGDLFNIRQGVREAYKSMSFTCPEDIAPVFVGASENYYIRARILKAENLYKLRGYYLSPSVRNLAFSYAYAGSGQNIPSALCENNIGQSVFDPAALPHEKGFAPFVCTGTDKTAVYLGFTEPPKNGPYRILWDIRENPTARPPRLIWEYYAGGKWKPFNLVDETRSFTKIGFTVFLDNHEFTPVRLFGREMYYIRILDADSAYRKGEAFLPIIENILENTVRAVNVDSRAEEYFRMHVYRENAAFTLSGNSILELAVYVDETDSLRREEIEALDAENRLFRQYDETGMVSSIWVRWQEVAAFVGESPASRVYTVDRSAGVLRFGNGQMGRIPAVSDTENIRAVYTTGGGKRSNVEVGQIQSLERSVGFITGVSNPKRFSGGYDTETLQDAMKRSASLIRTQNKAVTARDYEQLAQIASRSILGVHCCPGYNIHGEKEGGAVTLVILKDGETEFSRIRSDVLHYLTPRIAGGIAMHGKLYVTEPEFVRVNVRAVIAVRSTNDVYSVKKAVEERLRDLLDGNAAGESLGSRIGRLPGEQQLRSCIMSLDKVVHLSSIYMTTYVAGAEGFAEIDTENLKRRKYILPANGTHDITITIA